MRVGFPGYSDSEFVPGFFRKAGQTLQRRRQHRVALVSPFHVGAYQGGQPSSTMKFSSEMSTPWETTLVATIWRIGLFGPLVSTK